MAEVLDYYSFTGWFSPQVARSAKSELRSTDAIGKAGHRVVQLLSFSPGH